MGNVTVVFADGSKQMAHNLDDLRLRHELRKLEEASMAGQEYKSDELYVYSYSEPKTAEEARVQYFEISAQIEMLNQQRHIIKSVYRGEKNLKHRTAALTTAIKELDATQDMLKAYLARTQAGKDVYTAQIEQENIKLKRQLYLFLETTARAGKLSDVEISIIEAYRNGDARSVQQIAMKDIAAKKKQSGDAA